MRKFLLTALCIIFLLGTEVANGLSSNFKTLPINRDVQADMNGNGQKQEWIVPSEPLDFDTTLNWKVTITKKTLYSEKAPAFFSIAPLTDSSHPLERKTASASGSIVIPKGARYKITASAGEYSFLLSKVGAGVHLEFSYAEAIIRYSQTDQPLQFEFAVSGLAAASDWKWAWGVDDVTTGRQVTHKFIEPGANIVRLEAIGAPGNHQFSFQLEVSAPVELKPLVEPLKGAAELNVAARAGGVVNYGQKAVYNWDFGNGVVMSGPEAHTVYTKPGRYQVILTAQVGEYTQEKTWLVEVTPLKVSPNPQVTPTYGPVPLKVTGKVNPKVEGGPTKLNYSWNIGAETQTGPVFNRTFTEPGEYRLILKTEDELHTDLGVPDEVILIKALPPQITLKPTAAISEGVIPLTVKFEPGIQVEGTPVELSYRWDFGDGGRSNEAKPSHVFTRPGKYQVQLVVSDRLHPGNLADGAVTINVLPPKLKAGITPASASGLVPLTVNFYGQASVTGSPSDPQYHLDFGDGSTSVEQNPVHVFTAQDKYTVTLKIEDRLHPGNQDQTSITVDARLPKLKFNASVTPSTGTAPLTVNCLASASKDGGSNADLKITWDFGDGTQAEGSNQTHIYQKPGVYPVLVMVEDAKIPSLTDRKTFRITVR